MRETKFITAHDLMLQMSAKRQQAGLEQHVHQQRDQANHLAGPGTPGTSGTFAAVAAQPGTPTTSLLAAAAVQQEEAVLAGPMAAGPLTNALPAERQASVVATAVSAIAHGAASYSAAPNGVSPQAGAAVSATLAAVAAAAAAAEAADQLVVSGIRVVCSSFAPMMQCAHVDSHIVSAPCLQLFVNGCVCSR